MTDAAATRLPDFVVIGAMKAGTTTVFRWLAEHPDCDLPDVKEPHFFSLDTEYAQGLASYARVFDGVTDDRLTGEASASYADPRIAETVAERMHEALPRVRLVYLVRHPEQRLKSHYLHRWRRSRERQPLHEALAAPTNPYVALSSYASALVPFVQRYGTEAVLLVRLDDLAHPDAPGWRRLTDFLGLAPVPGPGRRHNETATKVAFTPALLRWWEAGRLGPLKRLPPPVRNAARAVLRGPTGQLRGLEAQVRDLVVSQDVRDELTRQWEDVHTLVGDIAPPLRWTGEASA